MKRNDDLKENQKVLRVCAKYLSRTVAPALYSCFTFEFPLIPTHIEVSLLTVLLGADYQLFTFTSVISFVQVEGSILLHKRKMWIETKKI